MKLTDFQCQRLQGLLSFALHALVLKAHEDLLIVAISNPIVMLLIGTPSNFLKLYGLVSLHKNNIFSTLEAGISENLTSGEMFSYPGE